MKILRMCSASKSKANFRNGYNCVFIGPPRNTCSTGLCRTPILVGGKDATWLARLNGATELAPLVLPFEQRHELYMLSDVNAPSKQPSRYSAITLNEYGKGRAIYLSAILCRQIEETEKTVKFAARDSINAYSPI